MLILTAREREVVGLLAKGYKYREIASKVFLSPYTINKFIFSVMQKNNCRNNVDLAVRFALENFNSLDVLSVNESHLISGTKNDLEKVF